MVIKENLSYTDGFYFELTCQNVIGKYLTRLYIKVEYILL